jgi:hypothetical protein
MQPPVEVPTPTALADLIARCDQINRFETQLAAAEATRIAALAAGILVMRQVLDLQPVDSGTLPTRQGRIQHWALTGGHLKEAETPAIAAARAMLVLDEHEQVKVLSQRTWRGQWRNVTLWHNKENGISAADVMEYLARLVAFAHRRAPEVARGLLARSEGVETAMELASPTPRGRSSGERRASP